MTRALLVVVLAACGGGRTIASSPPRPLAPHETLVLGSAGAPQPRMVPPEVFLRAYLQWFGELAPLAAASRARGSDLFDRWAAYLGALGLPDHAFDLPRLTQSNPIMLATLGRLGEALCVRAAEHDLVKRPAVERRVIFAFEPVAQPSLAAFAVGFDVLHRTFLGYPAELAPSGRTERFHALHRRVTGNHDDGGRLTADQLGWVAICTALVQHPETGLY